MSSLTPSERAMRGRIGAHISWANTSDRAARTRPARDALAAKFEQQVDPDGVLPRAELERRVASARSAHFTRLAYASARARRSKRG
jgi:hypothetical protein